MVTRRLEARSAPRRRPRPLCPRGREGWQAKGVALGVAGAALLALASGCATKGDFRKLEERVLDAHRSTEGRPDPFERIAALSAEIESLRADQRRLQGELEVARKTAEDALEQARKARETLAARSAGGGAEYTLGAAELPRLAALAGRLSVALFDAAAPNAARLGFDPEYAAAAGAALNVERDRPRRMAVRYETSFDTRGADGVDYGLAPRAGVSMTGDGAAVETGATVRLGRYIDTEFDRPAWWFFAGADRQRESNRLISG